MLSLTLEQRKAIEKLWMIYGNHGPKHSDRDHKFIQRFLDEGSDTREFYRPSKEAIAAVEKILGGKSGDRNPPDALE